MKRLFAAVLAAAFSIATLAVPISQISPTGSTSGQAIVSTGAASAPGWANVAVANVTGAAPLASPTGSGTATWPNFTASGTVTAGFGVFTDPSNSFSTVSITNTGSNGANLKFVGNGATTPGKTLRVLGGSFQIVNNAFTGTPMTMDDAGNVTFTGTITGSGFPSPTISGGTISNAPISGSTGSFTTLAASSTVSGTGFSNYLASPPCIGCTTPGAGTFTTLKGNSLAKVFATNTSGQSIPNNTATTITGWTTSYDANSNFNASTGVFTAPTAGDYLVSGQLLTNGSVTVNDFVQARILANNANWAIAYSPVAATGVTANVVQFSAYVHIAAAGQTILIQEVQNSGGALPLSTGGSETYLSIVQIP